PEGLPSRAVIEPLGSLAYLQHRSAFAFSPGFELPLPTLSLAPRLAAYPLKKRLLGCCDPSKDASTGGLGGPSVVDAAWSQQLLSPFDASGLLPSLVNPLGYPRLLLVPQSVNPTVRLLHVGLDIPKGEAAALCHQPSPHAALQQQQQEQEQQKQEQQKQEQQKQEQQQQAQQKQDQQKQDQQQQKQDQQALPWAMLLPSNKEAADPVVYALYLRDGHREISPAAPGACTASEKEGGLLPGDFSVSYSFRRNYVWQLPSVGTTAGAERAVVLVVPPEAEAKGGAPGAEEECVLLQLAGPRRVLLKAGASQRKPRVVVTVGEEEMPQKEGPSSQTGNELNPEEGSSDSEYRTPGETEEGPRGSGGPLFDSGREEREDGRQLFTEEAGEEEEEEEEEEPEATSGSSGSSSGSSEDESSSGSSQGQED
ncbi:histone-lysine N-methyltransferase 2D-like, partial [Cyclospora cayetanensis]|uniref:Histone-lysine N-methyltransferase 2D-like n=1 Tax=Cyclospora cayetanensis TaxID=88456 RepID=A0A6P6RXF9_9EIME